MDSQGRLSIQLSCVASQSLLSQGVVQDGAGTIRLNEEMKRQECIKRRCLPVFLEWDLSDHFIHGVSAVMWFSSAVAGQWVDTKGERGSFNGACNCIRGRSLSLSERLCHPPLPPSGQLGRKEMHEANACTSGGFCGRAWYKVWMKSHENWNKRK